MDPDGVEPDPVIIVVNHPRSFIDIALVDGDGPRVRAKRTAQAEAIALLLQDLQTASPGIPVMAIGDYNAYQFNDGYTDPIAVITGHPTPDDQIVVDASPDLVEPDFVNLTDFLPSSEQYSFVFAGTPQAIDHVMVNTAAFGLVQGYAIARGNSDFPEAPASLFAGDASRPERASDHDMPVAVFRFPPPSADLEVGLAAGAATAPAGGGVTYTITVTNGGPSTAQNVTVVAHVPGGDQTATLGDLASGATAAVVVPGTIDCATTDGATIVATATVSSDTADPNAANNDASASVMVTNPAPVISGLSASATALWPANHKMVDVDIAYSVADTCGATLALSVTSNEAVIGNGDGNTTPDWEVVDGHLVRLRAERAAAGSGRIYTITVTAIDAAGGTSQASVMVTVPHDQGK